MIGWICGLLLVAGMLQAQAAEPWEADRLFWLNMNWTDNARYMTEKVGDFSAEAKGETQGKVLLPGTAAVQELSLTEKVVPAGGNKQSGWVWIWPPNCKFLPTGATDQAVEWPAAGNVDPAQGALSLFVQGEKWDAGTPQRETLLVLDGKAGSLSIEKNQPNTLAVVLNGQALIETPLVAPDLYHHIVVNFEKVAKKGTVVTLYVDRNKMGMKEGVALPASYDRLVVGQLGPGPGTNKYLDNIAIYKRPLAQGEIVKIYYLEGRKELPKLVTVPLFSKAPKIDGIFDSGEWGQAAVICGFVDETSTEGVSYYGSDKPWDVADTIRVGYDSHYLYFAYHCPPPASIAGNAPMIAAMLKCTRPGFDTDVDSDDSLKIQIVKPYPNGDLYHLIVNGLNTHYEYSDGGTAPGCQEKGRTLAWNPKWITGTTLTMEGWKLEGAIPWNDLKMAAPQPGEELRLNFIRNWYTTLSGVMSWAQGSRHGTNDAVSYMPAGIFRFGGPTDVAVQLEQIGSLAQGNLDFRANLVNSGAAPAKVRVEMASNSGEIKNTQDLDIPAGGSQPYEFKARVVDPLTGDITFRVVNPADQSVLYAAGYPLVRRDHPSVYLRKYPSFDLVKFETEFTSLSQAPVAELKAECAVYPAGAKKAVVTVKASAFKDYNHVFETSTKDWAPGAYEARFKFMHKGKVLDTATQTFDIKPLPSWYNNTIGYDDPQKPPYPFNPIEIRGNNEVCFWGRVYRFGESLLPMQIEIRPDHYPVNTPYPGNGRQLLRAPMKLVGATAEAAFSSDQLKAAATWPETSGTRVVSERKAIAGNLAITTRVLMEYDGFCWVTVTLAPVQGTVTVNSLALEEPFTAEFSDVVNAGEYSLVGTGLFPTQPLIKAFQRPCWVGNGDGGLQTFTHTLAAFQVKDQGTTLQLLPGAQGATLRVSMIDQPLTLSKPYAIEFGFNATPARPRVWRTPGEQMLGKRDSYFVWYPNTEWFVGDQDWAKGQWWNSAMIVPNNTTRGTWFRGQPYMNTDVVTINDVDVADFGDEWLANPSDRWREMLGKPFNINCTYHSKSFRDWILWRMGELFKKAPYVGVYYDVVSPNSSANPYAGAGYEREDGGRLATSSLLGLREVVKRLYVLSRHTYPDGTTMFHDSGNPNMAYMAFGEIFFDGENLNSTINAQQPTYRGIMTPAMFRAEYMGHNFGPQVWWLAQGRVTKTTVQKYGVDVLEDHISGLQLLHQSPVSFPGGFSGWHSEEGLLRTREAMRKYELEGPGYRFMPYWQGVPVTGLRENQFVSFYVREPLTVPAKDWGMFTRFDTDSSLPHRVVGIFCNESNWKGEVVVKVDLKKLGFRDGAKVKAINAVHSTGFRVDNIGTPQEKGVYFPKPEETATLSGDELRFPMTEWNFRMIVLEEMP